MLENNASTLFPGSVRATEVCIPCVMLVYLEGENLYIELLLVKGVLKADFAVGSLLCGLALLLCGF